MGEDEVVFVSVELAVYLDFIESVCELVRHPTCVATVHVSVRTCVFIAEVA